MRKQKNCLIIADYAADYAGTFIMTLKKVAEKASEQGIAIRFLFPLRAKNKGYFEILKAWPISFCDFDIIPLIQHVKILNKQNNIDMVHMHFGSALKLLAIKLAVSNKCKVLFHYHSMVSKYENTLKKYVRSMFYKNTILIGVSEAVSQDLKQNFPNEVCYCMTNAVDFTKYSLTNSGGDHEDEFRILAFGSHFYRKGIDLVIKAIEDLPSVRLIVIAHNVENVMQTVKGLSKGEKIDVVKPVENIGDLYNSVDLFVSPSREEAFGYAVVEASYCNCQVLASDIRGQNTMKVIPHILWVEADNVEDLREKIVVAIENANNKKYCKRIKEEQREAAISKFDINRYADEMISIYLSNL